MAPFKIQRANLNGSSVQDLVTTGLEFPIGIALDVSGDKMYWTVTGDTGKIQRANLNGSTVEDLITTGISFPRGIALDVSGGKMYWTDSGTAKIQRANLDGSSVEDLVTTGLSVPIGIALDIQSSTPVPAASEWGLIALAAALVAVFVWGYMRRSAVLPRQL